MAYLQKSLLKHSFIYGASDIANRLIGFLLIPVYARFLLPDEYGTLQLLLILFNLIFIIVQFGIGSAIFKSVIYNQNTDKKLVYSTAFYFLLVSSLLFLTVIFLKADSISMLIFRTPGQTLLLRIVIISAFFNVFGVVPLAKLRIENNSLKFGVILVIKFVLQMLLNILFVVFLKKGIYGILVSECIVSGIFTIVYTIILSDSLRLKFSFTELKEMLEYGLPLIPASIAMLILTMSDRYLLKYYTGLDQVGYYSLAYKFGMIIGMMVSAFQKAWPSAMFNIAKERNAKEIFAKNFTYFFLFLSYMALLLGLFAKEIIVVFASEKYIPGFKIIPFISLAFIFYGVYYFTAIGLNIKKKTYYQSLAVSIAAALNIGLNVILIPRFGILGASAATLISFVVMAGTAAKISNHYYSVPYEINRIIKIFLLFVVFVTIPYIVTCNNMLLNIFIKICLVLLFPVFLIVFKFFKVEELMYIKKLYKKIKSGLAEH
ncbi:oligosaccharide flippase family protein [bacterium]|nr:oligosaccharide flippase family protein [bacterium]